MNRDCRLLEGKPGPTVGMMFLIFAAELLLTLLIQLPGIAAFKEFGFYDEGAWLHLVALVAGGAVPTVDTGYSYGMLPLIVSRAWVGLFGNRPWAFIGFVTACNVLAAWGVARILHVTGTSWRRLALACVLLPLAIMPNNYSLMHPLEMLLIVSALAQQARGRYGAALAWAVLAVLTKPSMAYVLGLVLLIVAVYLRKGWRVVLAPAITGAGALLLEVGAFGVRPAIANILPVTGGRSYRAMDFGIFHAGRDFWLHGGSPLEILRYYAFTPALFWILGSVTLWILGVAALVRLGGGSKTRPADPLLVTLALLHGAFVFVFYAWSGSWTYYSYLLVLGLLVGLRGGEGRRGGRRAWVLYGLVAMGGLGLASRYTDAFGRWWGMHRAADCGGLYVFEDEWEESRHVRELAAAHDTLFLVNGILPATWPEAKVPPVWFLSPGILADKELKTVRQEMRAADMIVLYTQYDPKQEAWEWPEFAGERALFGEEPIWAGRYYTIYTRKAQ